MMLKIWCIWLQEENGYVWLEAAWTDEQTAENNDGWKAAVDGARLLAHGAGYQMRIQAVNVPGVFELFEIPEVTAS